MTSVSYKQISELKDNLEFAFENGFLKASQCLGQLVNDNIFFNNFQNEYCDLDDTNLDNEVYLQHNKIAKHLVTTEIFGEVTGKSYLFLSDDEFRLLTTNIPDSKDPTVNYKEEFLKELDNIISAAVITELANKLQKKMYGNVPMLVGKVASKVGDRIYDDFADHTNKVYVNSVSFLFENNPAISPLFIWVMSSQE